MDKSEWGKFISHNNTSAKRTNLQSNENEVSCLTNVHVKSVRDLKEVFDLKRYNNFDKLIQLHVLFIVLFLIVKTGSPVDAKPLNP